MNSVLDFRPIFLVCGVLTFMLGVAMLLPAIVDFSIGHEDWKIFMATASATMVIGLVLFLANNGAPRGLSTRQAMLMTVLAWVFLVVFAAIPFHWSGAVPTFTDAFFESMSGLTTTGATVIADLESMPPGILFWRGLLQWLGGLGIIVMAVAVLPMLQIGGMQVFRAEAFDTAEKILPRATQISGSMTLIFIALTALCALFYIVAGMGAGDAFIHAMTTVATGGFSTRDASIGSFDNASIEWIAIVFMLVGSLPFLLYIQLLQGRWQPLFRDSQVRVFFLLIGAFVLVGWVISYAALQFPSESEFDPDRLRTAMFNVVSITTGTGYATEDYGLWGPHSIAFFFAIMFVGGCAGSTSCGIKVFRFQVLYADVMHQIRQTAYPHGVFIKRFNGRPLDERVSAAVMSFFFAYVGAFVVFAIALQLTGLDFVTAVSGAGSALSNVGPGLGEIIGPAGNYEPLNDTAKWLLSFAMLLGRLELFTVLVLFLPRFWQH